MYGVSRQEVQNEINAAIQEAYKSPTLTAKSVKRKREVPTFEELQKYIVAAIQSERNQSGILPLKREALHYKETANGGFTAVGRFYLNKFNVYAVGGESPRSMHVFRSIHVFI